APASGATLSGDATIEIAAADNVGISRVEVRVDSTLISALSAAPYLVPLDTRTFSNGAHTLWVVASDARGNRATASVDVSIDNRPCRPPTRSIAQAGGTVTVSWTGESGRRYQVQSITDLNLSPAGWQDEGPPLSGAGPLSYSAPATLAHQFFRVACR